MKKSFFLLLLTTFIFAQTPKPKIFFRSGFENNSQMFIINHDRMAIDQSDITYLPPNNWSNLGDEVPEAYNRGHYIYYQEGNDSQRIAEIINDPININNKAMHFKINEAYHTGSNGYGYGRVQSDLSLIDNPMKEYTSSIRLFLPHDIGSIAANGYNMPHWLTLMEIWMNPTWRNKLYPFRISLSLKKSSNQPLHFQVDGSYMNHLNTPTCVGNYASSCFQGWFWKWDSGFPAFSIPTGQWMTLRVYIKDGNLNTGKFKLTVTPDGEDPVTIFDITNWTHHEYNTNSLGIEWANPFKLYVSKNIIDYINLNNGSTNIYWDDFILCDKEGIDLQIRDTEEDLGEEPNNVSDYFWNSNDIWIRHDNDEGTEHQNPLYNPGHPNYVKVRVNNKSCTPSKGTNDVLKLYWAKANTALTWPEHWDGTLYNQGILLGNPINEVGINIPAIQAGKDIVLTIPWENIPDPTLYNNMTTEPWHFCLLARIESADDPMTSPEGFSIVENTQNNNNIAWKNVSVIYNTTDTLEPIGAAVAVENPLEITKSYSLQFVNDKNETGKPIYNEAEVTITMDEVIFNAWKEGGRKMTNLKSTKIENKMIVIGENASLDDIPLKSKEIGTIDLSFNFLTKEISDKSKFIYHVIQKDAENHIMGGETYEIRKDPKSIFQAYGGGDREIERNTSVTLSAEEINNIINYNWYDMEGNLIYTGKDLTVSPEITKKYRLEVIDIDGYKDYDVVEVKVNPFKIENLTPNPASNLVTVNYKTQDALSAYLMIVNINSGIAYNYILNTSFNETNLDISAYSSGLYQVVLICDGVMVDNKTLIKN